MPEDFDMDILRMAYYRLLQKKSHPIKNFIFRKTPKVLKNCFTIFVNYNQFENGKHSGYNKKSIIKLLKLSLI